MQGSTTAHPRSGTRFLFVVSVLWVPFWFLGAVPAGIEVALPVSALAVLCPLAATVLLVLRYENAAALRKLAFSTIDPRTLRPRRWWIPTVLLMPAILGVSALVTAARAPDTPGSVPTFSLILALVPLLIVASAIEEIGWIGYALPPLQERFGSLPAGLLIGVVSGGLHVPAWYVHLDNGLAWTAGMFVASVAQRVLMVALYDRTHGSVAGPVALHAMINICALPFPELHDPVVVATVSTILAGAVVFADRRGSAIGAHSGVSARRPADD